MLHLCLLYTDPPQTAPIATRVPPASSTVRTTKAWACTRTRELKARMKERRVAKKSKQVMYARLTATAAAGVNECCAGQGNDKEGVDREEEVQVEDRDALETLFRPPSISTTPPRRPRSLFSSAPSPLSRASTPCLLPTLPSELTLELDLDHPLSLPLYRSVVEFSDTPLRVGNASAPYRQPTKGLR